MGYIEGKTTLTSHEHIAVTSHKLPPETLERHGNVVLSNNIILYTGYHL